MLEAAVPPDPQIQAAAARGNHSAQVSALEYIILGSCTPSILSKQVFSLPPHDLFTGPYSREIRNMRHVSPFLLWLFFVGICTYYLFTIDMVTLTNTQNPEKSQSRAESGSFYFRGDERPSRVSFGYGAGASVRGWPSKGGFYTLYPCFAVELDFLGLEHFQEANRTNDKAEEEAHCKRMRQLGATWWASVHDQAMWELKEETRNELDDPMVYFGWPASGGVWVINKTLEKASKMGTGRIHIAADMEERCRIMEELGATYYSKPEDCPLLDLSDEMVPGVANSPVGMSCMNE